MSEPSGPTETPEPTDSAESSEPTPAPPASPIRSRRRLVIGIVAGVLAGVVVFVAVQFAFGALRSGAVTRYTSEEEHYSVLAPGQPTREEAVVVGVIPTTATRWTDGDRYYSVTSTELGGSSIPPSQRGAYLHFVLVGALSDAPGVSEPSLESDAVTNAFLTEPDEITLSGAPAFSFGLEVDGAPAPFHVVFSGRDTALYMLVYSDSDDSRDEDFLDSFEFLD
jgi:hypothetical protein